MGTGSKNNVASYPVLVYKAPEDSKESSVQIKDEVIQILRNKVKEDPKASAVFHVLALRERNRYNMTIRGLYYKMRREGFMYQQKEYAPIFRLLSELGLAKIKTGRKGDVQSIEDFKLPLQKLGALACGENVELNGKQPPQKRQGPTIVKVPHIEAAPAKSKKTAPEAKMAVIPVPLRLNLTMSINNKLVEIRLPEDITPEETVVLMRKLR